MSNEIKNENRTEKQNRALHLFFTLLANELNDAGFDMKKTLSENIDIPWTPINVKEFLWRPIQKSMYKIESTTEIDTKKINKIYDVINREIETRTGIHVPFPDETSINNISDKDIEKLYE